MTDTSTNLPETGHREDVLKEVARMFASQQFAKSPVMRRLLAFLVEKSAAGACEQVTATDIAIDALGKPADFDAQKDSYPRVQAGRLRQLIDEFYRENGSGGGDAIRLNIPKGSYVVDFDPVPDGAPSLTANYVQARTERSQWLKTGAARVVAAVSATLTSTIFLSQALASDPDDWSPVTQDVPADEQMASLGTLCPDSWTIEKCEEVVEAARE